MKTSLWELLESYNVVIPIIQRDYAQGRSGKEYLRKKILEQIGRALNVIPNESTEDSDKSDDMDFVYGTVEGNNFYPLDGQQRLTTLWLLHWYVAYKAGKLDDENIKKRLKKFSYETRTSSREICEKLCDFTTKIDASDSIVDSIQRQTWFYSAWKQDPTIQAMLRMLRGTKIIDEKNIDFIDGIEELLKNVLPINYLELWKSLTRPDCPLTFSILPIGTEELPISDSLYVKMNARGKQLTDFENFKAELVDYIHNQANKNSDNEDWKQLDSPKNGFAQKLDNAWTDIFWELKSEDESGRTALQKHIDEIFFAFFNRYFFNSQAQNSKEWNRLPLYGGNNDDTCLKFYGLEPYLLPYGEISFLLFQEIEKILYRWPLLSDHVVSPSWEPDSFHFLPEYQKNKDNFLVKQDDDGMSESLKVTDITVKQRAVFFAICQWLLNNSPTDGHYSTLQEKYFQDWRRVVWNIVENSDVENNLYGALKLFGELASHSGDIIVYLATQEVKSTFAKEQVREESLKAKKIDEDRKKAAGWETKIREAENYAFFRGAIRFLFTDTNGNVNWNDFDTKWGNAYKYFDTKGVTGKYLEDAKLLRRLLAYFVNFDLWKELIYDSTKENWHDILLNTNFWGPVHKILINDDVTIFNFACYLSELSDEKQKFVQEFLIRGQALSGLPTGWKLVERPWDAGNGVYDLDPRNRGSHPYFVIHPRINLLKDPEIIILDSCSPEVVRVDTVKQFWGIDIFFKFDGYTFRWHIKDNQQERDVYFWDVSKNDRATRPSAPEDAPEDKKYYCFKVKDYNDRVCFKDNLKELIEDFQKGNATLS